jgi:hypothetical protein
MKRKSIWLLAAGTLLACGIVLALIFSIQPTAPFAFMEGQEWRRAKPGEHVPGLGEQAFAITGRWPAVKNEATAELEGAGYSAIGSVNEGILFRNGSRDVTVSLFPDIQRIGQADGSDPCTITVYVSGKVVPRSVWDRFLSLFGAQ